MTPSHLIPTVSRHCVDVVKSFEGFIPHRYDDGTGVLTVGYGTTTADVSPLPASMTEPQAAALLERKLNTKYLPPIARALQAVADWSRNLVEASVSFGYNLGESAFTTAPHFETLQAAVRSGSKRKIIQAFLLYDDPNSPAVHAGLKRRREFEAAWAGLPDIALPNPWAGWPPAEVNAMHEFDHLLAHDLNSSRRAELRTWMSQRMVIISGLARPKADGGDGHGWLYGDRTRRYESLHARTRT